MTSTQILSAVAAAGVVAWPWIKQGSLFFWNAPALRREPSTVGYEEAIHNLALVRSRLVVTGHLEDEQKKSIDTLTLALVAGSDK